MKKKIILLFTIILFLTSCGTQQETKKINEINNKPLPKIESYQKIISPLDNRVKNSFEFKECMQQASLNCAEQASYKIAAKNGDTGICTKIQNPDFKQSCIDNANYLIALDKQDIKLCNNIKNEIIKRNCTDELKYKIALKNKDVTYCETKNNPEVIQNCKNEFYYILAIKDKNKNYCEKITDTLQKEGCKEELNETNKNKTKTNTSMITK